MISTIGLKLLLGYHPPLADDVNSTINPENTGKPDVKGRIVEAGSERVVDVALGFEPPQRSANTIAPTAILI